MGGHHVRRRGRRAGHAVEVRQEQLPVPRRHGLSLNEKTVFRARLRASTSSTRPASRSTHGFSDHDADHRVERRQPHADLRAWTTRGRTASRRPGQLARPADVPRAAVRASRTPTSSCRTSTSSRPASSASCRGAISLEVTYAGSRSYDIEGNFGGFNEPSAAFQAQCDVTQGGSRTLLRPAAAEPVLQRPRVRGHDPVHEPDALAFELSRPFPAFTGFNMNQQNNGKMKYDSLQLVGQQALGERRHHQRQLHLGAALDRGRARTRRPASATPTSTKCRSCRTAVRTSRIASTASPRRACGNSPWHRTAGASWARCSAGGRSRRCSSIQSGQPWDMPGNVDLAPGVDPKESRDGEEGKGSSSTA